MVEGPVFKTTVRVPVFDTVGRAYSFVWQARRDFLSLAFLAAVLAAVLAPGVAVVAGLVMVAIPPPVAMVVIVAVVAAAMLAIFAMFAVAWHRRYLVPDETTTVRAAFRWRRRQTRFLLIAIALFVLSGVSILPFLPFLGRLSSSAWPGAPLFVLALALYFLMYLVVARLSLLFPSTAVDHRMSFRECWQFTRGNTWRLFFIIFLVAATASAIPWLIVWGIPWLINFLVAATASVIPWLIGLRVTTAAAYFGLLDHWIANLIVDLVGGAFVLIGIAVGVSALSIAYRTLMAGEQAAPTEATGLLTIIWRSFVWAAGVAFVASEFFVLSFAAVNLWPEANLGFLLAYTPYIGAPTASLAAFAVVYLFHIGRVPRLSRAGQVLYFVGFAVLLYPAVSIGQFITHLPIWQPVCEQPTVGSRPDCKWTYRAEDLLAGGFPRSACERERFGRPEAVPAKSNDAWNDGWEAFERGDYATALRKWRATAEQDDPPSMLALGCMYAVGTGVPRDYVQAFKWWHLVTVSRSASKEESDRAFCLNSLALFFMSSEQTLEAVEQGAEARGCRLSGS